MSPQNNQEFPNERIIIFVTQFKDSSHIKEYAIGIYLFSQLKHADADYNARVEGHTSAREQPLPMQCTSSFSSRINIANITSEHIQELFYKIKTCPWSCVHVVVNLISPFSKIMSIFQFLIKSSLDINSSSVIFVAISVS